MGWARKNEIARIYRERRKNGNYILALENEHGNFNGYIHLVKRLNWDKWTVKRDGEVVHIQYDGVTQQSMGNWTTLCLPGKTCKPSEATDQEVLGAYLGDENIYTGAARYPQEDLDAHFMVLGRVPDPFNDNVKRVSFADCPQEFQAIVREILDRYSHVGVSVEKARGLHRMGTKVTCKFCGGPCDTKSAHLHQGSYVCEGCWDERLRATA